MGIDNTSNLESTLCDMLVAGSGDDLGEEEDDERTYVPDGWMLTWRETVVQVCLNRKFLSEIQECLFVTKQLDHLTPVTDFSTCRAF